MKKSSLVNNLNISAGLRNEWESLRNVDNLGNTESKRSYSAFQPKIAVSYDVLENKMLYASYSRGFRSGAYNPIEVPESNLEKEVQPEPEEKQSSAIPHTKR